MSTLYITEYQYSAYAQGPAVGAGEPVACGLEPSLGTQIVSISGSSAQSATLNLLTHFIRLHTDTVCSVVFGANPTANTSHMRLAANQTEFFGVSPELGRIQIAVIANI